MSTSQFTNQQIADYVSAVMGGAGTDAEKAAAINAAAQQYDVTREQLAASTGYGLDVVNQYLGALPTTNAGMTPTSTTGALSTLEPVSAVDSSPLDFSSGFKQFVSNLPEQTQLTEQQQAQNYYNNLLALNPTATKETINTFIKETPFSSPYYDELLTLSGGTSTTPTSTGALSTVTTTGATTGATTRGLPTSAVDTVTSPVSTDTTQSALSSATATGALPTSTTQGALQTATSPTQSSSVLDVFGLDWNTAADLATKQGYIQTLLNQGVTPEELKSKFYELDPVNATAANFYALGIEDPIRNAFLEIYDDPNKEPYEKAQELKALIASSGVSLGDVAASLGLKDGFTNQGGIDVLNTFLNQPSPAAIEVRDSFAKIYNTENLSGYEKATQINQILSTKGVSRDQLSTALKIDKKDLDAFLDQPNPSLLNYTKGIVGDYTDPVESKSLGPELAYSVAQKLTANGVNSFDDIKVEFTPGVADRYEGDPEASYFVPGTPDITKYYSKTTGQEIDPVLFDDKVGTKVVITPNGIQKQFDPAVRVGMQLAANGHIGTTYGGAWTTEAGDDSPPGFGTVGMLNQLGQRIVNSTGISDINQLGVRNVPIVKDVKYDDVGRPYYEQLREDGEGFVSILLDEDEKNRVRDGTVQLDTTTPQIYNKATGQKIGDGESINLGGWGEGPEFTWASLDFDANGNPIVNTRGSSSSDLQDIMTAAAVITAPWTLGGSLSALGGGEAALLASESGIAAGGLGVGATTGLTATELAAADLALGGLGGSSGATSLAAGTLPTAGSLTSSLAAALPAELVQAGQTLYNTFNTVKPYLQAGNALYQASQGNIAGAISSGLGAAGGFGVPGAAEAAKIFNLGYGATQGNYLPVVQELLNQSGIGGTLANTKIAGDFTLGDAFKGASFLQALQSDNPTVILNSLASLTGSQDLKVAAAASSLVNTLNNPNATAFDIAMGVSRVSDSLNTASKQPPPTGALPTGGQRTVTGALGTDTATGAAGNDVIDEYNVTGGGGALITSGNPTEDQQIAIQQRQNAANQALTDYMGSGNDLSREGLVSQLQSLGLTADQAEGYAKQADQKINMNLVGADVMNRYSKIDPEFGTPQLERNTAVQELVAAGFSSDRANEILNGIDAQNAIKLENRLSIQSAYNNFTSGKGTEEQLRSALTSAGYTDAEINNLVTRGNAILEGKKLTPGEQAQERAANLPDIRAEIAGKSSFNEAYALAREKLGPGATFTWQGKDYVASSAAERPDLTGTTTTGTSTTASQSETAKQDTTQTVESGQSVQVAGPGGRTFTVKLPLSQQQVGDRNTQGMLYNRDAVLTEIGNNLSTLAKANSQAAIDYLKNNPNSPWTQSISTAYEAAGTTMRDLVGGGVLALGDKPLAFDIIKGGEDLIKFGQSIGTGPQDTANWEETTRLVQATTDPFAKIGIVAGRILDGNSGLQRQVENELRQELPGLFFGGGTVRGALIASGLLDSGETGGSATIEGYQQAINQGKPHEEALAAGRARGAAEGTTELVIQATLGKITDVALGRKVSLGGKAATRVGSETLEETLQEGLGSVAGDVATGQAVAVNTALTKSVLGGYTGKGTSLTTAPVSTAQDISEISNPPLGSDPEAVSRSLGTIQTIYGDSKATQVVNTLSSSTDLAASGQTIANSLANVLGDDAAATISNNLVANFGLSSASDTLQSQGVTLNNLSTVVGKTDSGNDITLGDALGASITGNGQQVADSTVVGTKADGTNLTLGDLSTTIKTGTAGATTGATTGVTTDATTNAATQTGVTGNVNADTSTTTDPNTGVTTNTAVDTNTGTTTTTTTDPNTNTTTQTTVEQNTGVNTQTTTTTDQTSTTTVDTNTNVTTNTTVNTNTNTTTNITVNTNTGEVVVKVADSGTGEILDTQIKNVDELTPSELEKLTITDPTTKTPVTKTPVTKTPVTKPPVATAPKTGSSAGFSMFGEIGRLGTPMLKSAGDTQIKNPLEQLIKNVDEMNQIDPALLAVMAQRLNIQPAQAPTFTYGQETSIDDILGLRQPEKPEMQESLYAEGGYVEPLRAKPMNLQFMNRGGALPGGREDFKGGKHVAGDGDGQSDDIPAWLADGEFVFPADVVSALGNGSTKAGTDKLYKMMHEIRARARSTKVKDLPPPAHKSPLDYIKKGK